jgi:metal-sulfur cluster biosynthetic enzyme
MSALPDRVRSALEDVIDPCSRTAGTPLSVIDMGLLLDLKVSDAGDVELSMRATSAMCTMIAGIMKEVEERIAAVPGVSSVRVELKSGSFWTESEMTEKGRKALETRRQRAREEIAIKPHEWKSRRPRTEIVAPE